MRRRFGVFGLIAATMAGACAAPGGGKRAADTDYSVATHGHMHIDRSAVLPLDAEAPRFAWRDVELGCLVESDFETEPVAEQLRVYVGPRLALFRQWFGVDDVSNLRIRLHDRDPLVRDEFLVNGFHHAEEVHVFAGESARNPGYLDARSLRTIVHELAHACIYLGDHAYPRWLEEALCEVLSRLQVEADGSLSLPVDASTERYARCLFDAGEEFELTELLSYKQGYPEPDRMQAFYAQATSFVGFLLRERVDDLGPELARLTRANQAQLLRAGARWERQMRSR